MFPFINSSIQAGTQQSLNNENQRRLLSDSKTEEDRRKGKGQGSSDSSYSIPDLTPEEMRRQILQSNAYDLAVKQIREQVMPNNPASLMNLNGNDAVAMYGAQGYQAPDPIMDFIKSLMMRQPMVSTVLKRFRNQ